MVVAKKKREAERRAAEERRRAEERAKWNTPKGRRGWKPRPVMLAHPSGDGRLTQNFIVTMGGTVYLVRNGTHQLVHDTETLARVQQRYREVYDQRGLKAGAAPAVAS